MKCYSEFQPTGFDCKGLGIPDKQHWLVVPVSQTRDSETLERCNFETALAILGGEHELCEVHRFGHWGPGWFEIIIIHPALERFAERNIIEPLEGYPILDDEKFSEMELEEREEDWQNWGQSDFSRQLEELLADQCSKLTFANLSEEQDNILESIRFYEDMATLAEEFLDQHSEAIDEYAREKFCQYDGCCYGRMLEYLAEESLEYVDENIEYETGKDCSQTVLDSAVAEFLVPRMRQHDMRFAQIILDIYSHDTYSNEFTIEAESLLRFAEREEVDCV